MLFTVCTLYPFELLTATEQLRYNVFYEDDLIDPARLYFQLIPDYRDDKF